MPRHPLPDSRTSTRRASTIVAIVLGFVLLLCVWMLVRATSAPQAPVGMRLPCPAPALAALTGSAQRTVVVSDPSARATHAQIQTLHRAACEALTLVRLQTHAHGIRGPALEQSLDVPFDIEDAATGIAHYATKVHRALGAPRVALSVAVLGLPHDQLVYLLAHELAHAVADDPGTQRVVALMAIAAPIVVAAVLSWAAVPPRSHWTVTAGVFLIAIAVGLALGRVAVGHWSVRAENRADAFAVRALAHEHGLEPAKQIALAMFRSFPDDPDESLLAKGAAAHPGRQTRLDAITSLR